MMQEFNDYDNKERFILPPIAVGFVGTIIAIIIIYIFTGCKDKPKPPPVPPTPTDPYCSSYLEVPQRGIAMLHCNQTEARGKNCEKIVESMLRSCVRKLAANYLVNGTFTFTPSHMQHDINLLTSNGRSPEFIFYLLNGPGQRRCESTQDPSFEVRICPDKFRQKVNNNDTSVINNYKNNISRLLPTIDFAQARGGKVSVVVMLEDNLNQSAFKKLAEIAKQMLPANVRVGRNPCPGCAGGDDGVPNGYFLEKHPDNPAGVKIDYGVITNDGDGFDFPGENEPYPRKVSWEQLVHTMLAANHRGNTFLLWHHRNQGLTGGNLPPPASRPYKQLTESHVNFYINFLRQ